LLEGLADDLKSLQNLHLIVAHLIYQAFTNDMLKINEESVTT